MHSNFVFILVCCSIFFIAKGDKKPEEWRLKVEEGKKGTCSRKFKVETLKETCKDFSECERVEKGAAGLAGEKGEKGGKGDQGPPGECLPLGTKENPDTSCNRARSDTWIFKPKPFQVSCKGKKEICVDIPKTNSNTKDDINKRSTIVTKEVWLWPAITDYKDFYGYEMSQISHLVSISDYVTLDLMLHCYNFELKDNMQILLWDNILVGQNPTATSPVTYTVELNDCKNLKTDEWVSASISLKSWSTAIKNFYVKPEETTADSEQRIYLELKKLCFNF